MSYLSSIGGLLGGGGGGYKSSSSASQGPVNQITTVAVAPGGLDASANLEAVGNLIQSLEGPAMAGGSSTQYTGGAGASPILAGQGISANVSYSASIGIVPILLLGGLALWLLRK